MSDYQPTLVGDVVQDLGLVANVGHGGAGPHGAAGSRLASGHDGLVLRVVGPRGGQGRSSQVARRHDDQVRLFDVKLLEFSVQSWIFNVFV